MFSETWDNESSNDAWNNARIDSEIKMKSTKTKSVVIIDIYDILTKDHYYILCLITTWISIIGWTCLNQHNADAGLSPPLDF